MIPVLCVLTGDRLPDMYVQKLHSMLLRHPSSSPADEGSGPTAPNGERTKTSRLICLTDRQRILSPQIQQLDISGFNLKGWFNKLLLFNPDLDLPAEFLYLDVTLILKADPRKLTDYAKGTGKALVLLRDWHYDSYNTCAMWIRRGEFTTKIWNAYHAGEQYTGRLNTDQDYITGFIRSSHLESEVGLFPKEEIQSYKRLLKLNRTQPEEARKRARDCTILKFHGSPRPHEVLGHGYWLKRALRYPRHAAKDHRFLAKEIAEWWR